MSCDSGNCGCGGQEGKRESTENTPVTDFIKGNAKSSNPEPPPAPGPLSRAVGWIGHRVFI